jgi:tetraacyldisaccharide 4'-kinase
MNVSRSLWKAMVEGETGVLARWTLGPLLTTLSYPYNWAHELRLQAYHRRWAAIRRLPSRVISIGNLTLGGTGKTPIVELVAGLMQQEGKRVCVLSRGYGGSARSGIVVVSDGERCLVSPEVAGDEPVLLAEHLAAVPVIVGKDRYVAGMLAVERFGVDTIILDDGFQHVQLARDLDILLLDAWRPFGNGRLFPRGELRDRPAAIARADAIVVTRWESDAASSLRVPSLCRPNLPLFYSQHTPLDLQVLSDGQLLPLTSLKGRRVVAFCGIATPHHFRLTLERLGAEIAAFFAFPDHHPYLLSEIEHLIGIATQHRVAVLVTTEKDGVRLRRLPTLGGQVWALRIRATIVEQESAWKTYILSAMTA